MGISITSRPDKTTTLSGKTGRWLAVNGQYPVVFEFLRQDYKAIVYERTGSGKLAATIPLVDLTGEIQVGHFVYFHSVLYDKGTGEVKSVALTSGGNTRITVDVLLEGTWTNDFNANNYINLLTSRDDYTAEIKVVDSIDRSFNAAEYRPYNDGRIEFDVSSFVGLPLSIDNDYTSVNKSQKTISKKFYLEYTEKWSSNEVTTTDDHNYHAVSGAMQLQETHAPNLLSYTGFGTFDLPEAEKAKFLTDFENSTYWDGFPFCLHYIVENNDSFPEYKKVEEGFNASNVSTGEAEVVLSNPDYNYLNAINLTGSYPETDCELDVWIDSGLSPANSCGAIGENDWKYSAFLLNGEYIQGVYMESNAPASIIDTIDSYPNGELYQNGGFIDTLVYNATLGYYEPSLGDSSISYVGSFEARVLNVPVTTTAGESCTPTFSHIVYSESSENQPPSALNVTLAVQGGGPLYPGATIEGTYTFSDVDGDTEGATETYIREYDNFADADTDTNATGGTQITATSSYATTNSDIDKYYVYWVKPIATSAPTSGSITKSNVLGPIPDVVVSLTHNKQTDFSLKIKATNSQSYSISWGDSNTEAFTGDGTVQIHTHTYGSAGTYTVDLYGSPSDITEVEAVNQDVLTVDLSETTSLTKVDFNSNTSLTSLTPPTSQAASMSLLDFENCDITGSITWPTTIFTGAIINFNVNANLTFLGLSSSTGTILSYRVDNCNFTGTLAIPAGISMGGTGNKEVLFNDNPLLTGLDISSLSGDINTIFGYGNDISGNIDFGSLNFIDASVRFENNSGITGWDISSCTGDLQVWNFSNCSLSGTQTIDLNFDSVLSCTLLLTGNSTNSWSLDLTSTSGKMGSVRIGSGSYNGTYVDPGFIYAGTTAIFTTNDSPNITSIDLSAASGTMQFFDVGTCPSLIGSLDLTGFTWQNNSIFYCDNNGITSIDHSGTTGGDFDIYDCTNSNITGAHALGSFTFDPDSFILFRNNPLMTSLDLSLCSGEVRLVHLDRCNIAGTVDLTGFNFDAVDAEFLAYENASFTGFLFSAGATGNIYTWQCYSTAAVLQTNDMGALTIDADCNFEFFDSGLTEAQVDAWWNQLDSMDPGSGASGSLEGGGTNAAPSSASGTARTNLVTAGYTVIT